MWEKRGRVINNHWGFLLRPGPDPGLSSGLKAPPSFSLNANRTHSTHVFKAFTCITRPSGAASDRTGRPPRYIPLAGLQGSSAPCNKHLISDWFSYSTRPGFACKEPAEHEGPLAACLWRWAAERMSCSDSELVADAHGVFEALISWVTSVISTPCLSSVLQPNHSTDSLASAFCPCSSVCSLVKSPW